MTFYVNYSDIQLGDEKHAGHVYYPKARYQNKKAIFKENKFNNPAYSDLEVAFSGLANLFFAKNLTVSQKIVKNNDGQTLGVLSEHLCYAIARNQTNESFYRLNPSNHSISEQYIKPDYLEAIPFYFLNDLPENFFACLVEQQNAGLISIDYTSLASIFAASYALEEDDLHKGNFGFYIGDKNGKPCITFFKIDHDLMMADSIMSFHSSRFTQWFLGGKAFNITADDLLHFPNIHSSANAYWPTKRGKLGHSLQNNGYHDAQEITAFANLENIPEFNEAKWFSFYKFILMPRASIEASLHNAFDITDSAGRAQISLITQATIARQARLRAVLFTIPEFREYVRSVFTKEVLFAELELTQAEQQCVTDQFNFHKQLCDSTDGFVEGDTPLHVAIKLGDYRYDETLQIFDQYLNQYNSRGESPFDISRHKLQQLGGNQSTSLDIRKDLRLTMQHLIHNGANTPTGFTDSSEGQDIMSYHFMSPYIHRVTSVHHYAELKEILRDIGEDHQMCLKSQKNMAVECIQQFIRSHQHNPNLRVMLLRLQRDINWQSPRSSYAGLEYISQLRSQLWIIRQIRGLYGTTTTLNTMNVIIDDTLVTLGNQRSFGFFSAPEDDDDQEQSPPSMQIG
jgi:hypothetical protein